MTGSDLAPFVCLSGVSLGGQPQSDPAGAQDSSSPGSQLGRDANAVSVPRRVSAHKQALTARWLECHQRGRQVQLMHPESELLSILLAGLHGSGLVWSALVWPVDVHADRFNCARCSLRTVLCRSLDLSHSIRHLSPSFTASLEKMSLPWLQASIVEPQTIQCQSTGRAAYSGRMRTSFA
jgi:hypothetical protein